VNRGIALWPFHVRHHVDGGDRAAVTGQFERRPRLLPLRELHVRALDLTAGELPLDQQVEAHQRKGDSDGLAACRRMLRRPRIDDVLMDEGSIAAGEHRGAEGMVGILFGAHHRSLKQRDGVATP
jgi:hypothetical protein